MSGRVDSVGMTAQTSAAVASVHLIGRVSFAIDICGQHARAWMA
jgi:hypothetical protein